MIKRTQIKIKPCRCGCGKPKTISCNGYNFNCIPQLEKVEKINKHRQAKNKAQQRANTTRLLHLAQKDIKVPKTGLKRQNKPIPKYSKKRLADIKIYSVLRKDFLKDKTFCEVKLIGCSKKSVDVHHLYSGRDRNKYFTVVETWKATCRNCHRKVHDELSTEQLVELGLRKFD